MSAVRPEILDRLDQGGHPGIFAGRGETARAAFVANGSSASLATTEPSPDREHTEMDARPSLAAAVDSHSVVLVEGISDRSAVEALAERRGCDLAAEGIAIVPIGGAQAIGKFLNQFGPRGLDRRLAGLCDAAEEGDFRRALERAGLGSDLTRADMERLGFYVCVDDLEDELIRALGASAVEHVLEAHGDLRAFRTLQKQPAWLGRPVEEQLRRFMGSGGTRKIRYARLLVEALDLHRVPRPLDRMLDHLSGGSTYSGTSSSPPHVSG
jgi:hypothetical protein